MRVDNWEIALVKVIERHQSLSYAYGVSDCFVMAMDAIEAVTSERPFKHVRYSTEKSSFKAMRKEGFQDLDSLVASILSLRTAGQAQRGDIVSIPAQPHRTLGVVMGRLVAWRTHTVKMLPISPSFKIYAVD